MWHELQSHLQLLHNKLTISIKEKVLKFQMEQIIIYYDLRLLMILKI